MPLVSAQMMDNPLTSPPPSRLRLSEGRRVYVVGDVHGHRDQLEQVHRTIRADLAERPVPEPFLVHLGDLIDRGPDSAGCLDLLADGDPVDGVPTVNLLGNHEWMMLKALDPDSFDDVDRWLDNGGDRTLRSWGLRSAMTAAEWRAGIPERHLDFLRTLRPSWNLDQYVFVHAGVRPGVRMDEQREMDLLWIRDSFLNWTGPMLPEQPNTVVVHGHTPAPEPELRSNRIGLDTGAGKGGPLTCAVLEGNGLGLFQH